MRRFSARDLTYHGSSFTHLLFNCRLIIAVASVSVVLLAMNLVKTQVKVFSELSVLEELLVFFKFFVKDATVKALIVLQLACVDDFLELTEGLSVVHLIAKLREVVNPLLTHLCLKTQEVHNADVDVIFYDNVQVRLEPGRIARVGVKLRYVIGNSRVGNFDHRDWFRSCYNLFCA